MHIELKFNSEELVNSVQYEIRKQVEQLVEDSFDRFIKDMVRSSVERRVKELADQSIRDAVVVVLSEGWQKTNSYGEPVGGKLTLSSTVRSYLTDSGPYGDKNAVDKAFREVIDKELKGELGNLIAEAREKLRAMLDKTIADKMRSVVAEAIR